MKIPIHSGWLAVATAMVTLAATGVIPWLWIVCWAAVFVAFWLITSRFGLHRTWAADPASVSIIAVVGIVQAGLILQNYSFQGLVLAFGNMVIISLCWLNIRRFS
ncbi:MAG: hypothetical protein WC107_03910 [Patescibacteria group bacterium]